MSICLLIAGHTLAAVESARPALEPLDCQLVRAPGAALAFYLANKNYPDLIICHPDMTDGSGMQLLIELKSDAQLESIPFLFVCPDNRGQDFYAQALKLGAREVIVEPADGSQLLQEIKPYLQERGQHRPLDTPE